VIAFHAWIGSLAAAAMGVALMPAPLQFRAYADTGILLTDIVWTGDRFLYVENTTNTVWAAGPAGTPLVHFASMPSQVEETRCRLSPGAHGFARREIFCHAPDNKIYRISADGSTVTVFAQLPETSVSDGALAFDTTGKFGYALVAATGRSGGPTPAGGTVFAVSPAGNVLTVGNYAAPGGADELVVAPARFGSAAGNVVLAVDAGGEGTLVVMDPRGRTRTIARLPDGPNPIVVVERSKGSANAGAPPGLYVVDTFSHQVLFAAAPQFVSHAGHLIVGTELKGQFWIVQPRGSGFQTRRIATNLPSKNFNLEGATYVSG
jgi:hypothetical protein